jgi:dCTP deaminase
VAYGARLESGLGEIPQGFKSPILRCARSRPWCLPIPRPLTTTMRCGYRLTCPVLKLPRDRNGVLPNQYLAEAIAAGLIYVDNGAIPTANIQPASVDLRLGNAAYELRCSFLPTSQTVAERLGGNLVVRDLDLSGEGAVLSTGHTYLVPLKERLSLPRNIRARANPKSSTGRADVFTRVISDNSVRFDDIVAGYRGRLFLEVVPLSFPVRVSEDLSLNQLRLSVGRADFDDRAIFELHEKQPILFTPRSEVSPKKLTLSGGLFLGLDLRPAKDGSVGYRARNSPPILDLRLVRSADPRDYWEHVDPESEPRIVLEPKRFYLLMSYEAVTIPPTLAAEMTAYDPTSGELRTHYAGFFDPGFGYDEGNRFNGSTAALEVRAHDVPFMVEHRQPVCKLTFEKMMEPPTELYGKGIGSNYQQQTETLGKHFRTLAPETDISRSRRRNRPDRTAGQLALPEPKP